ncbi:MAG: hypothetical protein NXI04_13095 [Planctomycetaceae bacterium]|nr:hypothetical protein [Planctomycetaceae bacterium]
MKRFLFLSGLLAAGLCVGCQDANDSVAETDADANAAAATESAAAESKSSAGDSPAGDPSAGNQPADSTGTEELGDAAADSEAAKPQEPPAVGCLRGVVLFNGAVPAPLKLQATKDEEFCSLGTGSVQDVQVTNGRLAGAVVELRVRGAKPLKPVTPEEGFVLRQKDCLFTPRLLVAFDGAVLTVHNDDKVQHNVNTGSWNLLQSPGGEPIQEQIVYQGTPFSRVTCNIHSWMESWVYIARSPYYAVSAEDGQFEILDVPPGHYRGTISHATLGKQNFKVDIGANREAVKTFQYPVK